ncbi:MAG: branched-chain amino acid aminotransferase [Phycisphaerae bacterium]|nr:branched-chain amino acid aminotransferase [Phycisphaerae bacterium]
MNDQRLVYFNGEFVPEREAKVSIFDSALMFGDMVFEMTRSFGRVQFRLEEHVERLYAGVRMLKVPLAMTPQEMIAAVHETIEANASAFAPNDEHRVMIDVTRGPLSMYARVFDGKTGPNVIISVFPFKWTIAPLAPLYETGVHAVIPSQRAIPADLLEPKIKNRSRMHYLMANLEVSLVADKTAWALLLDPDGFIAEGTGSNFFIVKDGCVLTPEPRNILRGTRRKYTIELARRIGLEVRETNLNAYDAITADEAFFTSTAFTLMPCVKVNGNVLGDGATGPITQKIIAAWNELIGLDFIAQARDYLAEMGSDAYEGTTMYRFGKKD